MKQQKLRRGRKIAVAVVMLVALVASGLFISRRLVAKKKAGSVQTYRVRREVYENVIEIAGTVNAAKKQSLQAQGDGTVVGVYKKEGDRVRKGELILQEDDSTQKYNLAKLDYDIATARTTGARREIELLETQRISLVQKITERKIVATFDGVIASLDVDVGDYLEAKDSIGTLVDTSYLTAEVEIAETDVAKLVAGQKVLFTFPAYHDTVEGYLVSYPAIGETTSRGATVVKAKVRIDDAPPTILPNFSFTGKIQITEPENKLVVERYAIGHERGVSFVEIVDASGKTQRVEVEVEPFGAQYVNILRGLSGGERLKAQSDAEKSGRLRVNSRRSGGGSAGGAGGFGGPPPGR